MSRKPTLSFKDLSVYQLNLLRSTAIQNFINEKPQDASLCMAKTTFDMISAMGYKIVIDEDCKEPGYQAPGKTPENPKQDSKYWYK